MPDEHGIAHTIAERHCWWTISSESLVDLLRRAHAGEDPERLYAQAYLEADGEDYTDAA